MTATSTQSVSTTMVRTEFLAFMLGWAVARLVPRKAAHARKAIRQAIGQEVLEALTFYGMDAKGRCCATLRLELDNKRHRQELLAHPRIRIGSTWTEQVAPDFRLAVDTFDDLVLRWGLSITVLLQRRPGTRLVVDGRPLRLAAAPEMPFMVITPSVTVKRLPELSIQYALAEDTASSML